MVTASLTGVFAAAATAVDAHGAPDIARTLAHARFLLEQGCDGLNVLGTTGEATSFSVAQRQAVMDAYHASGLPLGRQMVGTGASALADAIALTRHAADLGFGGALVLPPFYYKNPPADGLAAYIAAIMQATADRPIPIYLYHFPGMSAVPWPLALIAELRRGFGARLAGLKDSSGDLPYARDAAKIADGFAVFPSNEATLPEARAGLFAGCISATANVNAELCGRYWRNDDRAALDAAVAIRKLFDGKPLVAGIKALLSHIHGDAAWARMAPPLAPLPAAERPAVFDGHDAVRKQAVA